METPPPTVRVRFRVSSLSPSSSAPPMRDSSPPTPPARSRPTSPIPLTFPYRNLSPPSPEKPGKALSPVPWPLQGPSDSSPNKFELATLVGRLIELQLKQQEPRETEIHGYSHFRAKMKILMSMR